MNKWVIEKGKLPVLAALFLLFIAAGCSANNETDKAASEEVRPPDVRIVEARGYDFNDPIQLLGEAQAKQKADLNAKVSGEIQTLHVKRGDRVKKGQKIMTFNHERLELQQKKQQQELEYLEKQFVIAVREEDNLDQLTLQLEQARLTLQELALEQKYHIVTSPIEGVITELFGTEGSTVAEGTPVATVIQLDPLVIVMKLTEYELGLIQERQELDLSLNNSQETFRGKVAYISSVMNLESKTYNVEVDLENNNNKVKPGMQVSTVLNKEEDQNVLAIPNKSVLWEDEHSYVFVFKNNKVEKRQVELGRVNENLQEIVSGLKQGEQVVADGLSRLKDGLQVQVIE
ncbi:efflux RND transporter periplasmic adaptor subunit [Paenibacillus lentus]|uniref:efflux RND transporter periplasmic adaptor subunit n=1 Tax=Paenibacillus lentus TaxID=1338368 RepID=UPI003661A298